MLKFKVNRFRFIEITAINIFFISSLGCSQTLVLDECPFEYSDLIKDQIVLPIIMQKFGDLFPYFDVISPAIISSNGKTKLIFAPINRVNGQMTMMENSYVFIFDSCTNELIEHYKVTMN